MSEMSRLALATLISVEERCDSLGWGFIIAYDDGEGEAMVYQAGANHPTFTGKGKTTCEALEKLAEDIVEADLKYTEKIIHDSKTEEADSTNQEPSGVVQDENHVG